MHPAKRQRSPHTRAEGGSTGRWWHLPVFLLMLALGALCLYAAWRVYSEPSLAELAQQRLGLVTPDPEPRKEELYG